MMITPQARRRIAGAVEALQDMRAREIWQAWAQHAGPSEIRTNVPYEIAEIALAALSADDRRIAEQLNGPLDDDTQADLSNDLGYIRAIETALRAEGVGR